MLSEQDLLSLIKETESAQTERTISTTKTDKFAEAVCAFANDLPNAGQPGYLLVGVKDNGELSGLTVTDELLRNLAALRSDGNILPLPAIEVSKHVFPGGEVAVVKVTPSDVPPVRYKGQIWIRVGPRKAIASEQEERILSQRRSFLSRYYDSSPCGGATLQDLDLGLFSAYRQRAVSREVVEENHRSFEEQLAALRFYDLRRSCPTIAGILVFGANPRYLFPNHYVQYAEFSKEGEILREEEIDGDLLALLRDLEARLKELSEATLEGVTEFEEKKVYTYPPIALRELVFNAVLHRDYQASSPIRLSVHPERIEIQNPGSLFGDVKLETIQKTSSYRNPSLAEAMKVYGYVNRYGYGIQRAQQALLGNGSPRADFREIGPFFEAIVWKRKP